MKTKLFIQAVFALAVAFVVVSSTGCASNQADSENVSVQPWNSQRSWENGLPAAFTEGR